MLKQREVMYIIIFCQLNDQFVQSLCKALLQKGETHIRIVTDMELAGASWQHQAGSNGRFITRLRLKDGFEIEPGMIKAVVNRIPYFQMVHFIKPADRQYAEMEIYSLYISFLRSVEEKLIDGMPIRQIALGEPNALYFYSMAIKAGMRVLDNQFTSSPRWQPQKELGAWAPHKKSAASWYKRSPHLVWENKPVLYHEPFVRLLKMEVVAGQMVRAGQSLKGWTKKIKLFSDLVERTVYTITLADMGNQHKFYEADPRPAMISESAMQAFANLLAAKK